MSARIYEPAANQPWLPDYTRQIERACDNATTFEEYAKADLPDAAGRKRWIYVTDETGGAVPAFNDGTNWRRCTDRAIVS